MSEIEKIKKNIESRMRFNYVEKNEIKSDVEKAVRIIKKKNEILLAILYGSYIDDQISHVKDVDIGIYVDKSRVEDTLSYKINLEEEINKETEVFVDIKILNDAPSAFLLEALRGEIIVDRGIYNILLKIALDETNALKTLIRLYDN